MYASKLSNYHTEFACSCIASVNRRPRKFQNPMVLSDAHKWKLTAFVQNLNTFDSIWSILWYAKYFYGDSNFHVNFSEVHQDLIDFHEFHRCIWAADMI